METTSEIIAIQELPVRYQGPPAELPGFVIKPSLPIFYAIMTFDLTDDETRALVAHLKHALEYDPFPYAPRLDPLKAILTKLECPELRSRAIAPRCRRPQHPGSGREGEP
jgi:hypothetical protein